MYEVSQPAIAADTARPTRLVVTGECIAICILIGLSLILHLVALDAAPISEHEAPQALSSWRSISSQSSGEPIVSDSPVLFWTQRISFGLLGDSAAMARFWTALAGVCLGLSPLFFRELLGKVRAYLFAVLLTVSPVLLTASRFSSGAVWAMLFAIIGLWALWRYWDEESPQASYGVLASVAFAALLLLSEPAGPILALILLGSGVSTLFIGSFLGVYDLDLLAGIKQRFSDWSWVNSLMVAAMTVVIISTGFMLFPGGLRMLAALLEKFLAGFGPSDGTLAFSPLIISLFYEPWLWGLALISVVMIYKRSSFTFVDYFFLSWFMMGVIAAIVYAGAEAAHGLWLIVPLAGMSSAIVADAFVDYRDESPLFDLSFADGAKWGKWLLALAVFVIVIVMMMQFQVVSRFFLKVPNGALAEFFERIRTPDPSPSTGLLWLVVMFALLIFGRFMAGGIWGDTITWQGGILGLFGFLLLSSVAVGWNVAVVNADNPVELWHTRPVSNEIRLIRETLLELSFRETQGLPLISAVVIAEEDSAIAWQLRDFPNVKFSATFSNAKMAEVVILPSYGMAVGGDGELLPDLGGSYVGQRVVLHHTWSGESMQGWDFLAWWGMRDVRFMPQAADEYILWVRQDIYDSEPFVVDGAK